jgi:flagellin
MSLGVLNNLSATYAENALNNTSNSLNTVLQQLSTGSRINSGADDAAGLSLVNGLEANQTALTQSSTNATEGVGLLQVADGALSQVTSLLNRAVTLATEASNGTLNSTQDAAANQEYQSILSEISNIGSTTTYNQEQVFGKSFNIYTGDSSAQSASINQLSIGTLSSSDLGQTNGTMNYSSAQGVFADLTKDVAAGTPGAETISGSAAAGTDTLTAAGSLTFTNLSGQKTTIATTAGESLNSVINAINTSGLGLTASLTTAGAAEYYGSGTSAATSTVAAADTGIEISGAVNDTAATASQSVFAETTFADNNTGATTALGNVGTGTAEISYSAGTGENLGTSDLLSQGDASTSLNELNAAIADVAAQDGYIGAQINTLDSVNSVLSTQQENIQSAQNAVQATDYASATSNMSKYEILSQTGIAALAQANSVQQEVTKLLQ